HLQGIIEADETFFPSSCKGQRHLNRPPRKRGKQIHIRGTGKDQVPVLVVRDRSGATADFMLNALDKKTIEPPLRAILAKDAIFCSDGAPSTGLWLIASELPIAPSISLLEFESLLVFTISRMLM